MATLCPVSTCSATLTCWFRLIVEAFRPEREERGRERGGAGGRARRGTTTKKGARARARAARPSGPVYPCRSTTHLAERPDAQRLAQAVVGQEKLGRLVRARHPLRRHGGGARGGGGVRGGGRRLLRGGGGLLRGLLGGRGLRLVLVVSGGGGRGGRRRVRARRQRGRVHWTEGCCARRVRGTHGTEERRGTKVSLSRALTRAPDRGAGRPLTCRFAESSPLLLAGARSRLALFWGGVIRERSDEDDGGAAPSAAAARARVRW